MFLKSESGIFLRKLCCLCFILPQHSLLLLYVSLLFFQDWLEPSSYDRTSSPCSSPCIPALLSSDATLHSQVMIKGDPKRKVKENQCYQKLCLFCQLREEVFGSELAVLADSISWNLVVKLYFKAQLKVAIVVEGNVSFDDDWWSNHPLWLPLWLLKIM